MQSAQTSTLFFASKTVGRLPFLLSTQVEKSDYKKNLNQKCLENIFFAIIIRLLLYIKNGSQTEKTRIQTLTFSNKPQKTD